MHTPKLISYLRTYSKQDWKDFSLFAKSVYNESSSQAQVISFYKKKNGLLFQSDWGRNKLLNSISPKITDHALSNILVKLASVVEQYFVWQETRVDRKVNQTLLLKNLAKRSLKKVYFKLKDEFTEENQRNKNDLWTDIYMLQIEHLTYFESLVSEVDHSRELLEKIIDLTTSFYDNIISFYSIELTNREITIQEEWSAKRDKIKEIKSNSPIIDLSQKLISLKTNRNHEEYLSLKTLIKGEANYSRELRYTVFIHLTSYLNNKIKNGKIEYSEELLSLYITGLNTGILINNGNIPILRFYNILNIACGAKQFAWAEEFVNNYVGKVNSPHIEATKILAMAEISFKQADFHKVINSLVSIKYRNIDQELKARWLLTCSEFELNRDNVLFLEDRVRSMIYFLKRNKNKVDIFTFEGMTNMCKFLIKLSKPYDKDLLKKEISEAEYLTFRPWLLSKVN